MTSISLEEAQAKLSDLIHGLLPGDELAIIENNRTIAKLIAPSSEQVRPVAGRGKGAIIVLSEDDDHLEDFKEYMA